ncbi:MAG: biotin/lipoate A/B protein ligase family protein, partial [Nitrospinota bacterium]
MKKWRLIFHPDPCNGFYNMAVDETLATLWREEVSLPVLRIYQWSKPTLTVGYGQKTGEALNTVYLRKRNIDLIRRVTGGRGVLHWDELTYSVISGRSGFFPDSISGTNKIIQAALLDALFELGIAAQAVRSETTGEGEACFSASSFHEINVEGKKISGSAQRRLKSSFIQHGSILLSTDTEALVDCFRYSCPTKKEAYLKFLRTRMAGINEVTCAEVGFEELREALIKAARTRFQS